MPTQRIKSNTLINAVSTLTTSNVYSPNDRGLSFHATGVVGASTGTAVINIECSNDNTNWMTLGAMTLSMTTSVISDGFDSVSGFGYYRAKVTTLTGTATVSVYVSGKEWS